jgi:hypothetical protein
VSATASTLAVAFREGLGDLDLAGDDEAAEVVEQAREAGRRFAAAQRWAQLTGDRVDTATLRRRLGITRQALAQRVAAGTIVALPGTGTTWYPTWQFRPVNGTDRLEVRPVTTALLQQFRDQLGDDLQAHTIVSWAATPQPELDGRTPRAWIAADGDDDVVVTAAARAAAALAR